MQRHPLIQGSTFSSCTLHARITSETSHQVLLSLDLWHAHQNFDVIKTHQSDVAEKIPHINLVALTSHITSRSCRHIQLSCFGVSPLSITCVAFFPLFVFSFVWVLFLVFFECLLLFTCILACSSTILVCVAISLLSHALNCFSWTIVDSATCFTHMNLDLFTKSFIHVWMHLSITSTFTKCRHASTVIFSFSFPSASRTNLGLDSAFTETALHNLGKEGSVFLYRNAHFFPGTVLQECFAHFWGTVTVGPENYAM